ncbi:hypothetical protein CYMTET_40948 [Cymbomonas tetramitiformis]|uniref:Uncharacterized protein n=1 Tax=Cymbomonas tetramitiformis TaxID=36881 RepID=A0AAE0F2S2_9CHLO|nr:hypothetical protein CYMTET_40948 [Cymbomonas tetramitiformis]
MEAIDVDAIATPYLTTSSASLTARLALTLNLGTNHAHSHCLDGSTCTHSTEFRTTRSERSLGSEWLATRATCIPKSCRKLCLKNMITQRNAVALMRSMMTPGNHLHSLIFECAPDPGLVHLQKLRCLCVIQSPCKIVLSHTPLPSLSVLYLRGVTIAGNVPVPPRLRVACLIDVYTEDATFLSEVVRSKSLRVLCLKRCLERLSDVDEARVLDSLKERAHPLKHLRILVFLSSQGGFAESMQRLQHKFLSYILLCVIAGLADADVHITAQCQNLLISNRLENMHHTSECDEGDDRSLIEDMLEKDSFAR